MPPIHQVPPITFDAQAYGPEIFALLEPARLFELGPGQPQAAVRDRLQAISVNTVLAGRPIFDRSLAMACISGLWLYHDYLDESHTISQDIPSPTGSYWHGLMHRRERDASNAKYWFHQVGEHAIFEPLADEARRLAAAELELDQAAAFLVEQTAWDPMQFIDLCRAADEGRASCELLCRRIQLREWQLLFDDCYRGAGNEI